MVLREKCKLCFFASQCESVLRENPSGRIIAVDLWKLRNERVVWQGTHPRRCRCRRHRRPPLNFAGKQVAPLLDELNDYTELGPTLRGNNIDVDHMIASAAGVTVGSLLDQVLILYYVVIGLTMTTTSSCSIFASFFSVFFHVDIFCQVILSFRFLVFHFQCTRIVFFND